MELRKLDPTRDAVIVARLFLKSADFVRMTEGTDPGPPQVARFFQGVPPGGDLAQSLKLGLFDGPELLGIADLGYGYPEPDDAYIGLLLFAPEARGRGYGKALLALIEDEARARGSRRIFAGVIEVNAPARAFWLREGYLPVARRTMTVGARTHRIDRMAKTLAR